MARFSVIGCGGIGLALVLLLLPLYLLPTYWVHIPAAIDWIVYPRVLKNHEVRWTPGAVTRKSNQPNIIVILADDLGMPALGLLFSLSPQAITTSPFMALVLLLVAFKHQILIPLLTLVSHS
jgi:hypothetical protein